MFFFFHSPDKPTSRASKASPNLQRPVVKQKAAMKFLYALSISIFAICNAQHSTEYVKLDDNGKDMMSMSIPKLQSHNDVAVCMNELDALGKILDDYRRIILSGLTASSDICGFIENLADVGDDKLLGKLFPS